MREHQARYRARLRAAGYTEVQISLPNALLAAIDRFRIEMGMTRSEAVTRALGAVPTSGIHPSAERSDQQVPLPRAVEWATSAGPLLSLSGLTAGAEEPTHAGDHVWTLNVAPIQVRIRRSHPRAAELRAALQVSQERKYPIRALINRVGWELDDVMGASQTGSTASGDDDEALQ